MLKIIVVEDEDIIREGIVSSIEEAGGDGAYCVVAQASDGEEAQELIERYLPDVIITDIKMPFMDGITMIEQIKPKHPEIYTVILSGHDEFEYARRALKAGAYDYILKPIKIKHLMDVLHNIRMEQAEKTDQKSRMAQLEKESKEFKKLQMMKELILGKQVFGIEHEHMMEEEKELLYTVGIVDVSNVALFTIGCDYLELMEIDTQFEKMIRLAIADLPEFIMFKDTICECVVCIYAHKQQDTEKSIRLFDDEIKKLQTEKMKIRTAFGKTYNRPNKLHVSYLEAIRQREKSYLNLNDLMSGLDQAGTNKAAVQYMDFDDAALLSAVRVSNKQQIDEELRRLAEQMKQQKVISQLHMIMVIAGIYFDVSKLLSEVSYNAEDAMINNMEHFNSIITQSKPDAIVGKLKDFCYNISDFLEKVHSGKFAKVLRRAKEFIQNNFQNEDLMLDDVAQYAYISTSYLCVIFKKEAGMTFIEYLTRIRMEHAAKLLRETDMRNYEIAEACGYSNPTYFSTIFKKYFDVPPSIYKTNYKQKQDDPADTTIK